MVWREIKSKREILRGKSAVLKDVRNCRDEILHGQLLAIDPSISSASSSCGYAIFEAGVWQERGILDLPTTGNHSHRLHNLVIDLRKSFDKPDVLVVEKIGAFGNKKLALILNRVIGAVLSVWDIEKVVEMPPNVWHKFAPARYKKTDDGDAEMIGYATIQLARSEL